MERGPEHVLDEYLVLLGAGGSRDAIARLVVRWSPRLVRHAMRLLNDPEAAGDAVQDTWVSALHGLRTIEDPARFPAWIYAIASRKCADRIRANVRARRLQGRLLAEPTPPAQVNGAAAVDYGLDLTAAQRRLIAASLFYGEALTVAEVAAAVRASLGTVKSRLHHARLALKTHLEGPHT